jgi:hypothetical protein
MANVTANTRLVLIVRDPFDSYKRGDKITDQQLIQDILNSVRAAYVNRILLPEFQTKPLEAPSEITAEIIPSKVSKKSKE